MKEYTARDLKALRPEMTDVNVYHRICDLHSLGVDIESDLFTSELFIYTRDYMTQADLEHMLETYDLRVSFLRPM